MTAVPACPGCGAPLAAVVGDPSSASWLCGPTGCAQAFWPSELSVAARNIYQPRGRGYGDSPATATLRAAVAADVAAAAGRGSSVLPEQLPLLSVDQLRQVAARHGLNTDFAAMVATAIRSKGG